WSALFPYTTLFRSVGEGERRIRGPHRLRAHAVAREAVDVGRVAARQVGWMHAVERHQQQAARRGTAGARERTRDGVRGRGRGQGGTRRQAQQPGEDEQARRALHRAIIRSTVTADRGWSEA